MNAYVIEKKSEPIVLINIHRCVFTFFHVKTFQISILE